MTRHVRSWALAALAVFASAPATLQGGTIIWGTPSLINAAQPTQVVNTGNVYSAAYNNPFTVNSVLFNTAPSTVNYESGGIYGLAIPDADPSYSAILYGFYFIGGGGDCHNDSQRVNDRSKVSASSVHSQHLSW